MDATISTTKSKSDKKHYALYTVPGVGLEVLLISSLDKYVRDSANLDVSRMKAAAAMSVQVGSFADPPEAQGCAHFLEVRLYDELLEPILRFSIYGKSVTSFSCRVSVMTKGIC